MLRNLAATAILGAFACSPAASEEGGLPSVSPELAVGAVRDCASATSSGKVQTAELERLGWALARLENGDRSLENSLGIYGKKGGFPLILATEGGKGCLVSGGLKELGSFDEFKAAFEGAFERTGAKNGDHYFKVERDFAVLSLTGSTSEPAFRVTVIEFGDDN